MQLTLLLRYFFLLLSISISASFQPVDQQKQPGSVAVYDYTNPSKNHLELESVTRHILHTIFSRQYTTLEPSAGTTLKHFFTDAAYQELSTQLLNDPLLSLALKYQAVTTETLKEVSIKSLDSLMHPQWEVTIDFDLYFIKSATEIKRPMSAIFLLEPADSTAKTTIFKISSIALQSTSEPTIINHELERLKNCQHNH